MRIEMWNGLWIDEHGIEHPCILMCFKGRVPFYGFDKATREPIPDPPSAIPVSPVEDRSKP